jgi:hypothetical protein
VRLVVANHVSRRASAWNGARADEPCRRPLGGEGNQGGNPARPEVEPGEQEEVASPLSRAVSSRAGWR